MNERLTVGGHSFDMLRPSQPEAFLDEIESPEGAEDPDPYWAELWSSAGQMAEFVLRQAWPRDTPALELGCGIGLVGLAALRAGLQVTFSDRHELAVRTAVENAQRNGFRAVSGRVLDWRNPTAETWPLIFASDVLYERQLHSPLLDTLDIMLAAEGVCWIGDPVRSTADEFIEAAASRGNCIDVLNACGKQTPWPDKRFRLLRLTKQATGPQQDPIIAIE